MYRRTEDDVAADSGRNFELGSNERTPWRTATVI
jgi:hypothetical protein